MQSSSGEVYHVNNISAIQRCGATADENVKEEKREDPEVTNEWYSKIMRVQKKKPINTDIEKTKLKRH